MQEMGSYKKYNSQSVSELTQKQDIIKTRNGLDVWEVWTYNNKGNITDIRYYAKDITGGKTIRLGKNDFLYLIN